MLSLLLAVLASPASAANMALDPQTRLHVGASYTPGAGGIGAAVGFDARLTRVVAIDLGAFASPMAETKDLPEVDDTLPGSAQVLHAVYLAPGFRLPHAQPKDWAWEVFARGGGGVAWTLDTNPEVRAAVGDAPVRATMAGCVGADALVRAGRYGARVAGKAWIFDATQTVPLTTYTVVRPQFSVEALVQW
jgi:hypothetical protein